MIRFLSGDPEKVAEDIRGLSERLSSELAQSMKRAMLKVEGTARQRTPVDTGRLRASITHDVKPIRGLAGPRGVRGIIGSNVFYAPYIELGTGIPAGNPRHWPPADALNLWARRHGIKGGGAAVARAIGIRGGLEPRRMMISAIEDNTDYIRAELGGAVDVAIRTFGDEK